MLTKPSTPSGCDHRVAPLDVEAQAAAQSAVQASADSTWKRKLRSSGHACSQDGPAVMGRILVCLLVAGVITMIIVLSVRARDKHDSNTEASALDTAISVASMTQGSRSSGAGSSASAGAARSAASSSSSRG